MGIDVLIIDFCLFEPVSLALDPYDEIVTILLWNAY